MATLRFGLCACNTCAAATLVPDVNVPVTYDDGERDPISRCALVRNTDYSDAVECTGDVVFKGYVEVQLPPEPSTTPADHYFNS